MGCRNDTQQKQQGVYPYLAVSLTVSSLSLNVIASLAKGVIIHDSSVASYSARVLVCTKPEVRSIHG